MGKEYHDHIYVKHDCLFMSQREKINRIEVSKEGRWRSQDDIDPDDIHIEWEGRFFYITGAEKYNCDIYLDLYGEGELNDTNGFYLVNLSERYMEGQTRDLHW